MDVHVLSCALMVNHRKKTKNLWRMPKASEKKNYVEFLSHPFCFGHLNLNYWILGWNLKENFASIPKYIRLKGSLTCVLIVYSFMLSHRNWQKQIFFVFFQGLSARLWAHEVIFGQEDLAGDKGCFVPLGRRQEFWNEPAWAGFCLCSSQPPSCRRRQTWPAKFQATL